MTKIKKTLIGLGLLSAGLAFAQETAAPVVAASTLNSGDIAWMIVATALVLFMTPGLAFFYGGMVRAKNAVSTIMTSFVALGVVSLLWWAFGYSLAFSNGSGFIGGFDWSFFKGVGGAANSDYAATIPHLLFALFQLMFAIITPALIAGAVVERMTFKAYTIFICLWSIIVYAPMAHMVWGTGGLLRSWGFLDFAGGLVVHQIAGFSALAAAMVLGKRKDHGRAEIASSSVPLIAIGTGLLWFGWFGFNGGSALASGELAVSAFSTTHFAAASAALTWALLDKMVRGKVGLTGFCIGAVVGLVSVTPASGFVTTSSAVLIGAVGSAAAFTVALLRGKSQVDDALDVFACHGVGGLVGTLMTGLCASKIVNSAGADGGMAQFLIQLKGSIAGSLYAFVATFVILKVLKVVVGLRPSETEEGAGLDQSDHGEKAYV